MIDGAFAPFTSFIMGGFECSTHRRRDGRRLDVIAATGHDRHALSDYRQLAGFGMTTVRDGARWHLIEAVQGSFDWSSFDPMLAAAKTSGAQVVWDLLHYGWPDWTNPHDADFIEHFARLAQAAAERIGPGGLYVPINEISFLAWGGGEVGYLNPFDCGRGEALKDMLCKAAIAASRRIRAVDPWATIIAAEPLIAVHPTDQTETALEHANALHRVQFDAVDCLLGRRHPAFGGAEDLIDVVGINYYPYNQWYATDPPTTVNPAFQRPLADLLIEAAAHYRRPLFVAETGCEGDARPSWFRAVREQVSAAQDRGVDIRGICLYPILDHPGWDDDRPCPNGLLCGFSEPARTIYLPLASALLEHWRSADFQSDGHDNAAQLRALALVSD